MLPRLAVTTLLSLLLSAGGLVAAQGSGVRSAVTGANLPAPTRRLTDAKQASQALSTLNAEAKRRGLAGQCTSAELLSFTAEDDSDLDALESELARLGYTVTELPGGSDDEFFATVKKPGQTVIARFVAGDSGLLLGWCALGTPANEAAPTQPRGSAAVAGAAASQGAARPQAPAAQQPKPSTPAAQAPQPGAPAAPTPRPAPPAAQPPKPAGATQAAALPAGRYVCSFFAGSLVILGDLTVRADGTYRGVGHSGAGPSGTYRFDAAAGLVNWSHGFGAAFGAVVSSKYSVTARGEHYITVIFQPEPGGRTRSMDCQLQ